MGYLNDKERELKFENLIKTGLKKDDLKIDYKTFKLGIAYYLNGLKDLNKKCVFGLSIKETLVIREKIGFNQQGCELNFEEIKNKYEVYDIGGIFHHSIMIICRNIKNIEEIIKKELEEVPIIYKTLLGELNLSKKTFNILQSNNIYTLGDLISYSLSDLKKLKYIGNSNLDEIIKAVFCYGVGLSGDTFVFKENPSNSNLESNLEMESSEDIKRKKERLRLERLNIEYQKNEIQIKSLLTRQQQLEEEMGKIIASNNFKK